MLVHVRVLKDFFEQKNRKVRRDGKNEVELDDVLSSDLGFPATPLELPEEYQARINTEIVHLSYSRARRLTTQQKNWQIGRAHV